MGGGRSAKYEAIQELVKEGYTVTELAAVANTSRKSYYIWLKKRQIKTQQEIENAKILAAIRQIEKRI